MSGETDHQPHPTEMNICSVCGNEFEGFTASCPYCGAPAGEGAVQENPFAMPSGGKKVQKAGGQKMITVNIESGMPDVAQALQQLDMKLGVARQQGVALVKVIHGWGSSGTGGRIKAALPRHLADLRRRRVIRGFVAGDQFAISTRQGSNLISKYPELKNSMRTDRKNAGITFVEL